MHTNTLLMKLKQNTNLLKIGNKFPNKASKKLVYYAHIYSHNQYRILVWGNMIDTATKNKVQNVWISASTLSHIYPPLHLTINKEASRLYAELLLCVCWHIKHI